MTSILSPKKNSSKRNHHKNGDDNLQATASPTKSVLSVPPQAPNVTLQAAIPLLVSQNLQDNQKGIQVLIKLAKLTKLHPASRQEICETIILRRKDPTGRRIRTLLLSFMCDDVDIRSSTKENDDNDDDDSLVSALSDVTYGLSHDTTWEDDLDDFEGDRDHPPGRQWGALHFISLRFLVDCTQELTRNTNSTNTAAIDYSSEFWISLIQTLVRTIESGIPAQLSKLSLKFLRLLTTLDSRNILPMIHYTLLPFILDLQESGGEARCPKVKVEATRLLEVVMPNSVNGGK